ncbi:hypothetical protein RchiOBHm_Chr3g0452801 [Rosa chinensis]|uniref:Uncharacterized protein n=1 Tax=Rosa chinensis TaxID=74649 RepID=A0A2P6R6D3_ROSCH|nr:hypothetical protein RchiOBHm_Chr3g0452801 [Rosa chinensis]
MMRERESREVGFCEQRKIKYGIGVVAAVEKRGVLMGSFFQLAACGYCCVRECLSDIGQEER